MPVTESDVRNSLIGKFFRDDRLEVKENNYDIDLIIYLNPPRAYEEERPFKTPLFFIETKSSITNETNHFVQLLITIHNRVIGRIPAPKYIAISDGQIFSYIEFVIVRHLLDANVDWDVTPSDYSTDGFKKIKAICVNILKQVKTISLNPTEFSTSVTLPQIIESSKLLYNENGTLKVTEDFFVDVYNQWKTSVLPTIDIGSSRENLIPDLFLAELSNGNRVGLSIYKEDDKFKAKLESSGFALQKSFGYRDFQRESKKFWTFYEKPDKEELLKIISRRDLLLSDSKREKDGAFYTPDIWVKKAQQYLKDYLGDSWEQDYYIWDCCAGTGNLLKGLTNSKKIFVSTLDQPDVDILKNSPADGLNLKKENIFQFDFLNDDFTKCPTELQNILFNEDKRRKLVIYINPPYVGAGSVSSHYESKISSAKKGVAYTKIYKQYKEMGRSRAELFVQFLYRIWKEIPGCIIGEFSKLNIIQNSGCEDLRKVFLPKLEKCFIVPSRTFDNVSGSFPIGFKIWNCNKKEVFTSIEADIFNEEGVYLGKKKIVPVTSKTVINRWPHLKREGNCLGYLHTEGSDLFHGNMVFISTDNAKGDILKICQNNLIPCAIYFAVRLCPEINWVNSSDSFVIPNDKWKTDKEFQADCLAFTLFSTKNNVTSNYKGNHWLPFTQEELGVKIESPFMSNYLEGKLESEKEGFSLDKEDFHITKKDFSKEGIALYNSALKLWKYYGTFKNPNASLYDIRAFCQGQIRSPQGPNIKLGPLGKSSPEYQKLRKDMADKAKIVLDKVLKKVYDYGFLISNFDSDILKKKKEIETQGFQF